MALVKVASALISQCAKFQHVSHGKDHGPKPGHLLVTKFKYLGVWIVVDQDATLDGIEINLRGM